MTTVSRFGSSGASGYDSAAGSADGRADAPPALIIPALLNALEVVTEGAVRVENVVATGAFEAVGKGKVSLLNVLSAVSVDVRGAAVAATDVFVAQPCMYAHFFLPATHQWYGWFGGLACANLAVPLGRKPHYEPLPFGPYAIVMGEVRLEATGAFNGAILANGTLGSSTASLRTRGGMLVLSGTRLLGGLDMAISHDDGVASLCAPSLAPSLRRLLLTPRCDSRRLCLRRLNVMTLDCSFCKQAGALSQLSWQELTDGGPSTPAAFSEYGLFCVCPSVHANESSRQGVRFASRPASFASTFTITRSFNVTTSSGGVSFTDPVLLPALPSVNGEASHRSNRLHVHDHPTTFMARPTPLVTPPSHSHPPSLIHRLGPFARPAHSLGALDVRCHRPLRPDHRGRGDRHVRLACTTAQLGRAPASSPPRPPLLSAASPQPSAAASFPQL